MTRAARKLDRAGDDALFALFGAIAAHDQLETRRHLDLAPNLATCAIRFGASREDPETYFLTPICHYVYANDTALHVSAAAHEHELAEIVVAHGADVRARNRRGAEPLHYAADGGPSAGYGNRDGQRDVIAYLIKAGADPNALDKSGVAPMHRAVRNRSSTAVNALISNGADPRLKNKNGSTPLHLAVQNTGKSNSGSDAAKDEQRRIIALLLERGATPTDVDANGNTVVAAASSDWVANCSTVTD